ASDPGSERDRRGPVSRAPADAGLLDGGGEPRHHRRRAVRVDDRPRELHLLDADPVAGGGRPARRGPHPPRRPRWWLYSWRTRYPGGTGGEGVVFGGGRGRGAPSRADSTRARDGPRHWQPLAHALAALPLSSRAGHAERDRHVQSRDPFGDWPGAPPV